MRDRRSPPLDGLRVRTLHRARWNWTEAPMSLAVAIQMDPIESVNIDADSSFVLGLEAQRRGHALFHYLPRDMFFRDGRIFATARAMTLKRERGNHHQMGKSEMLDLAGLDVILMR